MFERSKKDDDTIESQDANRNESDKTFGSRRSKVTGRGGDAAVIGRSIQINGDLRGGEDLRIEGDVSGTVELKNSALTIGKEGKVKADVYARSIAVDGETKGDLYAAERISVHVNARVQGNIIAPKVSIEEGAHFKGSIEMDPAAVEKALGKTAANGAAKPVAENKSGKSADDKATPKKPAKDARTNLHPPSGTA
ncbi:MAG: polymer-forming cytoskeletal protein [Gammaproteobacteria bacterium]|nr:polymer-forming cytoskeletal protein [Gammaproteobacteria bacterium]MBT8111685.1 polymer-forming cytoskeletal protein [Gammaproteobacteria bacterium]NND46861.1 polymer-forming cytoskeletal protein [Woeseiaceae bacterium]NNL46383.1 polymer-forming cytoskeletal protein [Woeseiaceae bacterium]